MIDAVDSIHTILGSEWTKANTNSRDPTLVKDYTEKFIDEWEGDKIRLYKPGKTKTNYVGPMCKCKDITEFLACKLTTPYSQTQENGEDATPDHVRKMYDELFRINKAKLGNPDSDWKLWKEIGYREHHSHNRPRNTNIWRITVDYVLIALNIASQ